MQNFNRKQSKVFNYFLLMPFFNYYSYYSFFISDQRDGASRVSPRWRCQWFVGYCVSARNSPRTCISEVIAFIARDRGGGQARGAGIGYRWYVTQSYGRRRGLPHERSRQPGGTTMPAARFNRTSQNTFLYFVFFNCLQRSTFSSQ